MCCDATGILAWLEERELDQKIYKPTLKGFWDLIGPSFGESMDDYKLTKYVKAAG